MDYTCCFLLLSVDEKTIFDGSTWVKWNLCSITKQIGGDRASTKKGCGSTYCILIVISNLLWLANKPSVFGKVQCRRWFYSITNNGALYIFIQLSSMHTTSQPCGHQYHQTTRYNKTIIGSNHSHWPQIHFPEQHSAFASQPSPFGKQTHFNCRNSPHNSQSSIEHLQHNLVQWPNRLDILLYL
jgi:hypothetical protein